MACNVLGNMVSESTLRNVLSAFPRKCNYAFAYGSAVFTQQNQKAGKSESHTPSKSLPKPMSKSTPNQSSKYFKRTAPSPQKSIEELMAKEAELDAQLSAFKPQRDNRSPQELIKMIDMVFVVDNPQEWHAENIQLNRSHYSALKHFGPKVISSIQERMASGVYYNPFVIVDGLLLKYGVISTKALETDLCQWTQIYIAGRLHKPVLDLKGPVSAKLSQCLKLNRESALKAVLLQEGRYISKFTLYHGITELSYLGDTRMKLGENPQKTKNIVTPLMDEFDKIYLPLIKELHPSLEINEEGLLVQETTPQVRFKYLMALPNPVQVSLSRQLFRDPRLFDVEEVMAELSYVPTLRTYIRNSVAEVVWGSSILQTVQGVLSAGIFRSIRYAYEKLKKGRATS